MKKILFCIVALSFGGWGWSQMNIPVAPFLPGHDSAEEQNFPITVQHPQENAIMPPQARAIYLFGKVNLPNASLQINGQEVPLYSNGTFISFIPVKQGKFPILLTAQSQGQTYQAVRHITIPGVPLSSLQKTAKFDERAIYPSRPVWIQPGETLSLSARGTPGANVWAELTGLASHKKILLKENKQNPGTYETKTVLPEKISPRSVRVVYHLTDPHTKTQTKITAKQRINIINPAEPVVARVTDPGVKMRQLPVHQGSLYPYYRAFGEVIIDGRDNGLYHLKLGNGENAWLEEKKLSLLSAKTYRSNQLHQVTTLSSQTATIISWENTKQVPISIHEFDNRMEIAFYYTEQFDENFNFDTTSALLDRVEWKDPQDGVLKFILYFKEGQLPWGYAYQYEENNFILQLRYPPHRFPSKHKPLNGTRILLDAGHSPKRLPPYDGLVSPSGYLEYEANLALAEVLKPKLEAAGATVIMTREQDNHMSLPERYQKALQEDAHIFVSLHHNALPDTANPLAAPRGYSIYYTYPHSLALGESIYQAFTKNIPLADNGLIANDVLFIPRISEMPSILIENAYMILPEQEEMVMSPKGRELFAQTIYEGILHFYQSAPSL